MSEHMHSATWPWLLTSGIFYLLIITILCVHALLYVKCAIPFLDNDKSWVHVHLELSRIKFSKQEAMHSYLLLLNS